MLPKLLLWKEKIFGKGQTCKYTNTMPYSYSNRLICFYVKKLITWGKKQQFFWLISEPSIKRENNTNSHTNSFGIQRRREYFPTHSERTILLIWKPDKDIRKILQTNFSDEYIRKSHQQNISKPNSATSAKDFTSWSSGNYAWNATLI